MRTVLQLKYATRNIRGLGEKEEELDRNLNENKIKIKRLKIIHLFTRNLQTQQRPVGSYDMGP
jgi:hypothetical protein